MQETGRRGSLKKHFVLLTSDSCQLASASLSPSIRGRGPLRLCILRLCLCARLLRACFRVLFLPQLPGDAQSAGQDILISLGQANMRRSHSSPAAMDGKKNFGHLLDERRLLFEREHQVSISLFGGGEGGEDASADAKVG